MCSVSIESKAQNTTFLGWLCGNNNWRFCSLRANACACECVRERVRVCARESVSARESVCACVRVNK